MANTYGGVIICGEKERKDGSWYTTGMLVLFCCMK